MGMIGLKTSLRVATTAEPGGAFECLTPGGSPARNHPENLQPVAVPDLPVGLFAFPQRLAVQLHQDRLVADPEFAEQLGKVHLLAVEGSGFAVHGDSHQARQACQPFPFRSIFGTGFSPAFSEIGTSPDPVSM